MKQLLVRVMLVCVTTATSVSADDGLASCKLCDPYAAEPAQNSS